MTDFPESHRYLLDSAVGILSTNGANGIPQTTPVWFLFDEGEIKLWISDARQKVKNLLRDPACSFLILDLEDTGRYLIVQGQAECVPDTDFVVGAKVGAKYDADLRKMINDVDTRYAITIHATKVLVRGT